MGTIPCVSKQKLKRLVMTENSIKNVKKTSDSNWETVVIERPVSYQNAVKFAEELIKFHEQEFDPAYETNLQTNHNDGSGELNNITLQSKQVGFDHKELHEAAFDALFLDQPIQGKVKMYLQKLLREKSDREKTEGKIGRKPKRLRGRNYDWTIYRTTSFLEQAGWRKSENEVTYKLESGFHAIAEAMRNLSLSPQTYTSVRDAYYGFVKKFQKKRNAL